MKSLFSLIFFLGTLSALSQTIDISVDTAKGCVPHVLTLKVTYSGTASVSSVVASSSAFYVKNTDWDKTAPWEKSLVFNKGGVFDYTVIVELTNGKTLTKKSTNPIEVYEKPTVKFNIPAGNMCTGNDVCFSTIETIDSRNNNYIVSRNWDMGNGSIKSGKSICYEYLTANNYDVAVEIKDKIGCTAKILVKGITIKASPKPIIDRKVLNQEGVGCPKADLMLYNKSTTQLSEVSSWNWYWDTRHPEWKRTFYSNNTDDAKQWDSTKQVYQKSGWASPALVVTGNNGCSDSAFYQDAVLSLNREVSVNMKNCGTTKEFKATASSSDKSFMWDFGDGQTGTSRYSTYHTYDKPGVYQVAFSTSSSICGVMDTTFSVSISAVNSQIRPTTNDVNNSAQKPHQPIKATIQDFLDVQSGYNKNSIQIAEVNWVAKYPFDSFKVFHNASYKTVEDSFKHTYQTVAGPKNGGYVKTNKQVAQSFSWEYLYRDWEYGKIITFKKNDPIPAGNYYLYNSHIDEYPLHKKYLYDSDFYNEAGGNFKVKFTNFSQFINPDQGDIDWRFNTVLDSNLYSGFPYADDSLKFIWRFNDKWATSCTSSVANPNPLCNYSTQKLPEHEFTKNGCYTVQLIAKSEKPYCDAVSSVVVTNGSEFKPRATFKIHFDNCLSISDPTRKNVRLTWSNCSPQELWLVPDVAENCDTIFYRRQLNGISIDTFKLSCDWMDTDSIGNFNNFRWEYHTPGWKKHAFVVRTGNELDTMYDSIYVLNTLSDFNLDMVNSPDSLNPYAQYNLSLINRQPSLIDSLTSVDVVITKIASTYGTASESIYQQTKFKTTNNLVNKADTVITNPLLPGKYRIDVTAKAYRKACPTTTSKEIIVGHMAQLNYISKCSHDSVVFFDSIRYWNPSSICEATNDQSNVTCVDRTDFFSQPDSNIKRANWLKLSGYQLPSELEAVAYDFDNDGIIDLRKTAGSNKPVKYLYPSQGEHLCAIYSKDSTGFWQKNIFTISITNIDVSVQRMEDSTKYCLPQTLKFSTENHDKENYIVAAEWFVENQLQIDSSLKDSLAFHFEHENEFLGLKGYLTDSRGCKDTVVGPGYYIKAPLATFKTLTDSAGCQPLTIEFENTSKGTAEFYSWYVNNGEKKRVKNKSNFIYPLDSMGLHTVHLVAREGNCATYYYGDRQIQNQFYVMASPKGGFKVDSIGLLQRRLTDLSSNSNGQVEWEIYYNTKLEFDTTTDVGGNFLYTFNQDGIYKVKQKLTNNDDCERIYDDNISVKSTSISEPSTIRASIYPNPSSGYLTIELLKEQGNVQMLIKDLSGKQISIRQITSDGKTNIDLNALPKGVYFIELQTSRARSTYKIVLE